MNQLASFQAAEAQLRPWLMEKELMMSVLGPLSIDPNMLNAQKQQVQVSWEPRTPRHGGVGSRRGGCLIQYVRWKIALRVICLASALPCECWETSWLLSQVLQTLPSANYCE